ncbi:MAG: hypothetical protein NTZ28_04430 [Nitrospirae bacterium]|jgi:hypothetical protein|nr:hypothetical protein [Nitrospirota bacterium]
MKLYVVGVDLGQAQDYSAVCVVEAEGTAYTRTVTDLDPDFHRQREREETFSAPPTSFDVTHLERLTLGTPYPAVVARVGEVCAEVVRRLPSGCQWLLAVDETGVGRPIVDLLEQASLSPVAITISGGDTVTGAGRQLRVPKRDLVATVSVARQYRRLKIENALSMASTLAKELTDFRVKVDAKTAHDTYGAWREGQHDDLVLAVALACWTAERWFTRTATADEVVLPDDLPQISPY